MTEYAGPDRRVTDRKLDEYARTLAIVDEKQGSIGEDVAEIKADIRILTQSLQKLVIIDERQCVMLAAQERTFSMVGRMDDRVRALETAFPAAAHSGIAAASALDKWLAKLLEGSIVVIALIVSHKLGLL